ncbi:hypothetical protein CQW23_34263 [Capsicum baccatum]|uniref:Protein TAR1 n=1 Tax=Capsicum baccatum TaxID=33114 RepID=A0A2G2UZI7_CAPBA|nr:hypothetical protein CQW23_34263 [Capsicum baccatum]
MRRPALAAGAARAVHRQPTGLGLGPPCLALRANPFPEVTDPFCRLPLPTLFHRPEAVHLGDLMRYAHTRTLLRRSRLVGGAPLGGIPPIRFLEPYWFTRLLTRTHVRLLGTCFKMGRMGSPQASVRSAQMLKHAGGARCLPQSRRRCSTSVSRARDLAAPNPRWSKPKLDQRTGLSPFYIRPGRITGPHPLPSQQFQALFDSLFKVLFTFPSRHLFAIGLSPVFSLGRNSPPDLGCIPKQPDS